MSESLNGATRLYPIVGDPIAQVKSPSGVTRTLAERGHNAICVPAHVAPGDLADFFDAMARMRNVDGVIVTVPHKFASFAFCASTTPLGVPVEPEVNSRTAGSSGPGWSAIRV